MLALGFGLTSIVAEKLEVDKHQLLSCFGWSLNSRQCSKFICLYLSLDRGAIRQAAANTFQLQIDEQQELSDKRQLTLFNCKSMSNNLTTS